MSLGPTETGKRVKAAVSFALWKELVPLVPQQHTPSPLLRGGASYSQEAAVPCEIFSLGGCMLKEM